MFLFWFEHTRSRSGGGGVIFGWEEGGGSVWGSDVEKGSDKETGGEGGTGVGGRSFGSGAWLHMEGCTLNALFHPSRLF